MPYKSKITINHNIKKEEKILLKHLDIGTYFKFKNKPGMDDLMVIPYYDMDKYYIDFHSVEDPSRRWAHERIYCEPRYFSEEVVICDVEIKYTPVL